MKLFHLCDEFNAIGHIFIGFFFVGEVFTWVLKAIHICFDFALLRLALNKRRATFSTNQN